MAQDGLSDLQSGRLREDGRCVAPEILQLHVDPCVVGRSCEHLGHAVRAHWHRAVGDLGEDERCRVRQLLASLATLQRPTGCSCQWYGRTWCVFVSVSAQVEPSLDFVRVSTE